MHKSIWSDHTPKINKEYEQENFSSDTENDVEPEEFFNKSIPKHPLQQSTQLKPVINDSVQVKPKIKQGLKSPVED